MVKNPLNVANANIDNKNAVRKFLEENLSYLAILW